MFTGEDGDALEELPDDSVLLRLDMVDGIVNDMVVERSGKGRIKTAEEEHVHRDQLSKLQFNTDPILSGCCRFSALNLRLFEFSYLVPCLS